MSESACGRRGLGFLFVCAMFAIGTNALAGSVGDIQVVYFAPSNFDYNGAFNGSLTGTPIGPVADGPAFIIENKSSSTALTNVVLNIGVGGNNSTADSFNVGTIAASSYVAVAPGLSNDGGSGHSFFAFTGSLRDTSDVGPNSDSVPFSLTALYGGVDAATGTFTPAATQGPSNDNTVSNLNFLGGPGDNDGPCNNCFGPKVVAEIQLASVPEPSTWLLLATGLTVLTACARRRR